MMSVFVFLLFSIISFVANGSLILSNTLGSNMVLQREGYRVATIWGWANEGDNVTISLDQWNFTGTVEEDKKWNAVLPPYPAGGPYDIYISSSSGEKIVMQNILFGDVYVCGGQSNMEFPVIAAFNSSYEIEQSSHYPNIRLFTVGQYNSSDVPLEQLAYPPYLPWSVASPTTVPDFSAVCWFFAKDLYDKTQIPIGLVSSNWGGTTIEVWSSPSALAMCNKTKEEKKDFTATPVPTQDSVLWNSMIYPLLPMSIFATIWYQGEANILEPDYYACAQAALIQDWRGYFSSGNQFPFFFVQLAPFNMTNNPAYIELGNHDVARLRTAQLQAVQMEQVGYASAIDLGDPSSPYTSIHPRNKQTVGERLSNAALAFAYGEINTTIWQGPTFANATYSINKDQEIVTVNIVFDTYDDDIEVRTSNICPSIFPAAICQGWVLTFTDGSSINEDSTDLGEDDKSTVIVTFPLGGVPSYISYGYAQWPILNVFSVAGLPAIPFNVTL